MLLNIGFRQVNVIKYNAEKYYLLGENSYKNINLNIQYIVTLQTITIIFVQYMTGRRAIIIIIIDFIHTQ